MLILSFAYHVEQFNAGQNGLCPARRFKSQHRAYSTFDISIILLNQVVQILALPDGNRFLIGFAGVERGQRCGVGATFIDSDHFRFAVMANRLAKEA